MSLPDAGMRPVVLRPFGPDDLAMVCQAARDRSVHPDITSLPADLQRRRRSWRSSSASRARADDGHGYSLVIASADGRQPGWGSMGLWLRDIENGRATIGYWLVAGARGATPPGWALRGLVAFAFDDLAIPRLQLFVEPWNVASARTAEFAGFTCEGPCVAGSASTGRTA